MDDARVVVVDEPGQTGGCTEGHRCTDGSGLHVTMGMGMDIGVGVGMGVGMGSIRPFSFSSSFPSRPLLEDGTPPERPRHALYALNVGRM